jgi:predicted transcriptional regulator
METFDYGRKLVAALSDDTRIQLVRVLACGNRTLAQLEKQLAVSEDELKANISLLVDIKLVTSWSDGTEIYFVLSPGAEPIIRNFLETNHIPADDEFCLLLNIPDATK